MKIKLTQRTDQSTDGKGSLIFRVLYGNKQIKISTGITVKVIAFDPLAERVTTAGGQTEVQRINYRLDTMRRAVTQSWDQLEKSGIQITPLGLRSKYKQNLGQLGAPKKQHLPDSLPGLIDRYVNDFKAQRSFNTIRGYKQVRDHLQGYYMDVPFYELTTGFLHGYIDYLVRLGKLNGTINNHVKNIKVALGYGVKLGLDIPSDFRHLGRLKDAPDKIFLTWEEVERIEQVTPEKWGHKGDTQVKDIFLFSCYTGLRISDIIKLGPDNLRGRTLKIMVHKSPKSLVIPLSKKAEAIFMRYKCRFPYMSEQNINSRIKLLARAAKITTQTEQVKFSGTHRRIESVEKWKLVTIHTGRHTFACEFLRRIKSKSLDLSNGLLTLRDLMGHSKLATTESYLHLIEQDRNDMFFEMFD